MGVPGVTHFTAQEKSDLVPRVSGWFENSKSQVSRGILHPLQAFSSERGRTMPPVSQVGVHVPRSEPLCFVEYASPGHR